MVGVRDDDVGLVGAGNSREELHLGVWRKVGVVVAVDDERGDIESEWSQVVELV